MIVRIIPQENYEYMHKSYSKNLEEKTLKSHALCVTIKVMKLSKTGGISMFTHHTTEVIRLFPERPQITLTTYVAGTDPSLRE